MGENPTRQSLQPEAIGAVMEVTKWLKPSISVSRIGDSASEQAATRVKLHHSRAMWSTLVRVVGHCGERFGLSRLAREW